MPSLFKPMPGMVVCKLVKGQTHTEDDFILPDEEPSYRATVIEVGPHTVWWKRLIGYPKDLEEGDTILLKNTRGILDEDMLVVKYDEIRCKIK